MAHNSISFTLVSINREQYFKTCQHLKHCVATIDACFRFYDYFSGYVFHRLFSCFSNSSYENSFIFLIEIHKTYLRRIWIIMIIAISLISVIFFFRYFIKWCLKWTKKNNHNDGDTLLWIIEQKLWWSTV